MYTKQAEISVTNLSTYQLLILVGSNWLETWDTNHSIDKMEKFASLFLVTFSVPLIK